MITLRNIRLNNAKNKTFLSFDGQIEFKENTIYFIIGRSGVGKTSLIDFMTAPFTDDPIKNGEVILSSDIGLKVKFSKKQIEKIQVKNSYTLYLKQYVDFIRKSIALIPQKTDSFHPSISVVRQMYDYYKFACPHVKKNDDEHKAEFNRLLEELSPYAGWDRAWVDANDFNKLNLKDEKNYINDETGKKIEIVNLSRKKVFEGEFSTGQLQRILILMGLLRFHAVEHPILIGDEFLVNFTYPEANEVLKRILDFFMKDERTSKMAIFILHDLSFDVLKDLQNTFPAKLIAIEKDENHLSGKSETKDAKRIKAYEILLSDFFSGTWKSDDEKNVFEKYKDSYDDNNLLQDVSRIDIKPESDTVLHRIKLDTSRPYEGVYNDITLDILQKRFIVLTGFSGCGKSTLCNQFLAECDADEKKIIRYFPSRALSFLSETSQISIKQDLSIIYGFYNNVEKLDECKDEIKEILKSVCFYDNEQTITDEVLHEFLSKKIYDLSGGQQQRYWLARILFQFHRDNESYVEPDMLILDESIASLDCITKNDIISFLLEDILFRRGMSILFVSHDLRDINVIYKTICRKVGQENAGSFFEHYEMFHKGLYKVLTPFDKYKEHFKKRGTNKYLSLRDNYKMHLRFDANNMSELSNEVK